MSRKKTKEMTDITFIEIALEEERFFPDLVWLDPSKFQP